VEKGSAARRHPDLYPSPLSRPEVLRKTTKEELNPRTIQRLVNTFFYFRRLYQGNLDWQQSDSEDVKDTTSVNCKQLDSSSLEEDFQVEKVKEEKKFAIRKNKNVLAKRHRDEPTEPPEKRRKFNEKKQECEE